MSPWIGVDLEPGVEITRSLPDLDLLEIAFSAAHGGAGAILLPVTETQRSSRHAIDLFDRPGLPLLTVKVEEDRLDMVHFIGSAPDRVLLTNERGQALRDLTKISALKAQLGNNSQEIAVMVDADTTALKELSRAKAQWVFLRTDEVFLSIESQAAEAELAKISAAAMVAHKLDLRVALFGPTGKHLPSVFAGLPHVEEIFPTPDLWMMALCQGWERAVSDYRTLLR